MVLLRLTNLTDIIDEGLGLEEVIKRKFAHQSAFKFGPANRVRHSISPKGENHRCLWFPSPPSRGA